MSLSYQEQILKRTAEYCLTPTHQFKFKAYTNLLMDVFAITRLQEEMKQTHNKGLSDQWAGARKELQNILHKYQIEEQQ